jgi:integrase
MLPETPRPPYPITWDEQDRLFSRLPARLSPMVLFAVNTGLRESNVCGLEWMWEVAVPEVGRSVFVIPPRAFKSKRAHVVVLNDAAWSIVQAQRGLHPIWVFPYRGRRVSTMNNTAWQRARQEEDLRAVRIHDLRHTFGCRPARGWRISRRSGGSARSRQSFHGRSLCERTTGPAGLETTSLAARNPMNSGAPGRMNLGTGARSFRSSNFVTYLPDRSLQPCTHTQARH